MRWYELRNTGSGWSIYQEGTFSPDNTSSRWMGSIAMNGSGDIALGYSITSSTMVPSIAVTGRLSGDPLGQMTYTEAIVAGNASQSGVTRWGDYSRMSVDPSNDATFWYTQEYSNGGWDWKTKVLNFNLVDLGDPGIVATGVSTSQIDVDYSQHPSGDQVLMAWSPTGSLGTPVDGTIYSVGQSIPGGDAIVAAYGATGTYNHTGLPSSTTFYYKAWSNFGASYSPGRTASATTLCESVTSFPLTESFEGGQLPQCWSYEGNPWTYQNGGVNGNPGAAHTGSFNALFSNASTTADVSKLITPALNFSGYSDATFSFWHTQADWSGDQDELRVYYKTSLAGSWVLLGTYTASITTWTQETIVLPSLSTECYIGFEGTAKYGFGVAIDDFNISGTIGTATPLADFTADNTSPAIAEAVTFTDLSGNFPSTWAWSFSPTDVTFVGGTDANSPNPQVEFGTATNYTVTLIAGNAGGNDTETKVSYISICTGSAMNSAGTWTEQVTAFTTASRGIQYISIVDANTVWATAYDGSATAATIQEFTRTTDGGTTWVPGTMGGYANYGVSMIHAIDANTAFVPLFKAANPGKGGEIAVTTDGGANWTTSLDFGANSFCNIVHFFDANNGVSQGDPESGEFEIFRTTDGGANWNRVANANIHDPIAADEFGTTGLYDAIGNTIWFTTNKGRVYKSIDMGANWTVSQTPETADQLAISFSSMSSGIVKASTSGIAYRTSDGGLTWSTVPTGTGIFYASDYTYVPGTCNSYVSTGAGTPNGVSFSDNGGTDWADLNSPQAGGANVQLTEVRFFDISTGWAGQFNLDNVTGGIYKYAASCVAPVVTTEPVATATGCEGTSVSFTVIATGTSVTYQWQKGGVDINLAASATYTIASVLLADAGSYTCVITNACGTATSAAAVLTVPANTAISTQPVNATACLGSATAFTVTATGSNLSYQWRKAGVDITLATSATFSIATVSGATLTIPVNTAISVQPINETACAGSSASFTVTATGSTLSYQWRKSGVDILGATGNSFTIASVTSADAGSFDCVITGDCGSATTTVVSLTVPANTVIGTQPLSVTACEGTATSFTVSATGSGLSYQWRKAGVDISLATAATFNIASIAGADAGNYDCVITGDCGIITSTAVSLTVPANTAITVQPAGATTCEGTNFTVAVTATGANLAYQWRKGGVNLPGENGYSFSIASTTSGDAGAYDCVVTGDCGTITSNGADLLVTPATVITADPNTQIACAGTNVDFSVTATGANLSYVWKKGASILSNGGNVSGATSSTLSFAIVSVTDNGSYTCTVTGDCGNLTSVAATLTISLSLTLVEPLDEFVCPTGTASFSVTANGANPTYQWMKGGVNINNGGNISGANSSDLSVSNVSGADAGNYSCFVTSDCGDATSVNAALNLNDATVISQEPAASTDGCVNSNTSISVVATGTNLTYQWRKSGVNLPGQNTASLNFTGLTLGDIGSYNCVITGDCGSINSATAALNVFDITAIITEPTNDAVCVSSSTSFTVSASGANLSYQWRFNGVDINGANSATYANASTTTGDAGSYDCVVTGDCGTATSAAATLAVNPATEVATDPISQTACDGGNVFFSVVATGTSLTYQWQNNGADITGANSDSYLISGVTVANEASYTCIVSGDCGIITSAAAQLTITTVLTVSDPADNLLACESSMVTFTVTANGTNPIYNWLKNGNPLSNGGNISGATSDVLTISNIAGADVALYSCAVTSDCGNAESASASLTLGVTTAITAQPTGTTVCVGGSHDLMIIANGTNLAYQWTLNGADVTGANSASLSLTSVTLANAGNYICNVTGDCGNDASAEVTLTINPQTVITTEPQNTLVCNGSNASFSVVAEGGGLNYQWQLNSIDLLGENAASLLIANALPINVGVYTCIVTGDCGNATSAQATLNLTNIAEIISQPQDVNAVVNDNVIFTITTAGVTDYQWQKDGFDLIDGGIISGATTNMLTLIGVNALDDGSYTCNVSGTCGTATSNAGILLVSTSINELVGLGIKIFPNPSHGIFTISSQKSSTTNVVVTDITGKTVFTDKLTGTVNRIDLSDKAKGMYFIRLSIDGRPTSAKLIIE